VITTDRQYRIAKAESKKFERVIAATRDAEPTPGVHRRIHRAIAESLESELAILREHVERAGSSTASGGDS
jgi:hypothetical protein